MKDPDDSLGAPTRDDDAAAELIRAAAGRAAPLGEVRARGLVRAAAAEARARRAQPPLRRRGVWIAAAALGAAALIVLVVAGTPGRRGDALPERLLARSAGRLVPGPFPPSQSAAQRLDLVTTDRLIALREARCQAVARRMR